MKAVMKILGGGIAAAALGCAAPAAAQYYPGYGYGYGSGGVGQVINQVLGNGYNNGYGYNSQALVNQCAAAVQQRLNGGGYGYNGYNGYGGGRVLGISRVEPRQGGGMTVRGVASSDGYGQANLTWRCKTDYRGFIADIDINRGNYGYGNGYNNGYSPYANDYSQYGYRRY